MNERYGPFFASAIDDFHRARRQAFIKEILSRLRGYSVNLLSYEEVRKKLKAQSSADRGLQEIPLDAIVGSVNRYDDFTRDFLPRRSSLAQRWARVKMAVSESVGLDPVEVYQIGEAYFVKDGNHRVSIARQFGAKTIQAYVTEIITRVPFSADVSPEDLILKAEYAQFLERTHLDQARPEADLSVTVPGQYDALEEHISVHRYFMGIEQKREIPYLEAAAHWYDEVYLPVVQVIRNQGILRYFPGRTETDLYLWIAEHRSILEEELGVGVRPEAAASDLTAQFSPRLDRVISRLSEKVRTLIIPGYLEGGPKPGHWRREKEVAPVRTSLFSDILTPINGQESGWYAVEQALIVAQREQARLQGLHVMAPEADKDHILVEHLQHEFNRRCAAAGIEGTLVISEGDIPRRISERARWNDLIVLNLTYPPAPQPMAALSSGFRSILQRCPVPILAIPQVVTPLQRALLAYDGSLKSKEALYIATYLAGKWNTTLTVVTVNEKGDKSDGRLGSAEDYLVKQGITANYIHKTGDSAGIILEIATNEGCDLILMGGYSLNPLLDVVLGSTVDQVLRESHCPILICR